MSLDRGIFTGIQYIMFHLVRGKVYFHIFLSAGVEIKYKFMTTQQQKICVYCCGVKRWSCSGIKFDKTYYKQISFAMQIWCLQYLQSFISQFQNGLLFD